MSPERRAALVWLALGPGIWALAEAPHAPRLAVLTWAVSGVLVMVLGGGRRWPTVGVLTLGAATLARVWSGA
ncbi:MAG: hypothetical protein RIT28_2840 [Pseudomonadota bacterium]